MNSTCLKLLLLATLMAPLLASAQSSRTELRSLSIPGVGSWDFNVYLPPGYDQGQERYPVVYLFRGAVDEWLDRTEDASRSGRNIQSIADTLIAQKKMGGVILVMPGFTAMTGAATDADYSFILNSLIPHIDQNYRTIPSRWERGVDGFSLGGLHMINLIWRNPERFGSAGSYDGTFSLFNFNPMIAAGDPYFARLRPMQFLLHSAAVQPSNLAVNRRLDSMFRALGIPNSFDDLIFSSASQHNWWFADEHMIRSLPLHWSKFQNPSRNVAMRWTSSPATKVSGIVRLAWSIGASSDSIRSTVDYSRDDGVTWRSLTPQLLTDSTYDWDSQLVPDGTRYRLRVRVFGDTSYGCVHSQQRFTVDNPGNGAPDIAFESPRQQDTLSGTCLVRWFAEDPEGASLRHSLSASSDNGASWQLVVADLANATAYSWNTRSYPNAGTFVLRLTSSDGSLTSETISSRFEVRNIRLPLGNVKHTSGSGDGRIVVHIVDPLQLTGHAYKLTIEEAAASEKHYSLFDLTRGAYTLRGIPLAGDGSEGPLFDGLRISVYDFSEPLNNPDSTRWTQGSATLSSQVSLPTIYTGSDTVRGIAYPSDYEFRVAGQIVDTASTFLGAPATPLCFSVWNITESRQVEVVVNEIDGDGKISRFDEIYILEHDRRGQPALSWVVFFTGADNARMPVAGDVFTLRTLKPLRSTDVFEFSTTITAIHDSHAAVPDHYELSQNYPNPFNPGTTIRYAIPQASRVTLRIFNMLGQEVALLMNERIDAGYHQITWNANIPSGIYFYRMIASPAEGGRAGAGSPHDFVRTKKMILLR